MRIALITDTHWGARNDSSSFMNYFSKFYDDVFFPYLKDHNIKTCIHLGDLVDRRKYINFRILKDLRENFVDRLWRMGVDTHIIIGNHDTFYKNTNKVNSVSELFSTYERECEPWMYDSPREVEFDGCKILMMPWICEENYDECLAAINKAKAQILMGHLSVKGFEMHRGAWNIEGLDSKVFEKFDIVYSGHFHHKSTQGNITYLGNPYEITWSDYQDPRGFHIFDTETRSLEFIENPFHMFYKIFYDDTNETLETISQKDYSEYEGAYVKVVVNKKNNPFVFDTMLDKIYAADAGDISVIENHSDLEMMDDPELVDEAEDTLTILNKYIGGLDVSYKEDLNILMNSLYTEALSVETI